MRKILALVILATAAMGCTYAPGTMAPSIGTEATASPAEDSPDFDCAVDGNGVCGPTNDGPGADAWRECFAGWAQNPRGVTATEAAAECDAQAEQYGPVIRP